MCGEDMVGVAILVVQALVLLALFRVNLENRRVAKAAMRKQQEIFDHAAKVHKMVENAVGEEPPPTIDDPKPSLLYDLEKSHDR